MRNMAKSVSVQSNQSILWRLAFSGALQAAVLAIMVGCESADSRYDYGYDDGYAAGYNTTCNIRATMVKGDWDDEHYSRGYRNGYADGSLSCKTERQ